MSSRFFAEANKGTKVPIGSKNSIAPYAFFGYFSLGLLLTIVIVLFHLIPRVLSVYYLYE